MLFISDITWQTRADIETWPIDIPMAYRHTIIQLDGVDVVVTTWVGYVVGSVCVW